VISEGVSSMAESVLSYKGIANVLQTAEEALAEIMNKSGTLLYSACTTLQPGKYYFLGLNPGGEDDNTNSVRESLNNLSALTVNAYLDQDWGSASRSYGVGLHPLQKNFKGLFDALGEDPRAVCASNLIFTRSIGEKGAGGLSRAESCWPVHAAILEIVRPRAVFTFGRQPFNFIADKLGGATPTYFPAGHGSWTLRFSVLKNGVKLIGLPHLSRYSLMSHPEVVEEIKKYVP
jgi:hypothetical protein